MQNRLGQQRDRYLVTQNVFLVALKNSRKSTRNRKSTNVIQYSKSRPRD